MRGMEGGMEGFKLRSKLLKTKLSKPEVEQLCSELAKIRIIHLEDLTNLDSQSLLKLDVKPRVRSILSQVAKKHCGTSLLALPEGAGTFAEKLSVTFTNGLHLTSNDTIGSIVQ